MDEEDVVLIYSGISFSYKRTKFESTEERWINLEPVIQNEVSQKEKKTNNVYSPIYMETRKMEPMNLFARQE